MNTDRFLIASALCLGGGLAVLIGYCHGTAGFNAAYPFAGATFQLSVVTTGLPAILGFALTVMGLVLLLVAVVNAIMRQAETHRGTGARRESTAG